MWRKVILLLIYILFYFILLRSWDWLYYDLLGIAVPAFLDPFALNARQLHSVLDNRGVIYNGIVEKKELVQLVVGSGGANDADLQDCPALASSSSADNTDHRSVSRISTSGNGRTTLESEVQHFTSGAHFNEQVEDCKDSAWIVQVIARNQYSPLNERLWLRLIRTFSGFGIRFGTFDCALDYRMCQYKNWNSSRLLLALPDDGNRAKSAVSTYTYEDGTGGYRYQPLSHWIHNRVGRRVQQLQNQADLILWMHTTCQPAASVCILLVTSLTLPPFFLSALSVKFNGRIKFGMVGHSAATGVGSEEETDEETEQTVNEDEVDTKPMGTRFGRYLVITPSERSITNFGGRGHRREALNYKSLHFFLKWFKPDLNDVFVFSVGLTNLLALLTLFECRGHPLQILFHLTWTMLKYNMCLLLVWAALLSLINYRFMINLCDDLVSVLRRVCLTTAGRRMIANWLDIRREVAGGFRNGCANVFTFVSSFLGFNGVIYYLRRKFGLLGGLRELERSWPVGDSRFRAEWIMPSNMANGLQFFPAAGMTLWGGIGFSLAIDEPRRFYSLDDPSSDGIEIDPKIMALLKRLDIRDICLDPRVPFDYIMDLPTVPFTGDTNPNKGHTPGQSCPVCLDGYRDGDAVCVLPCDHDYHHRCIVSWLVQDQPNCPCCRQPANTDYKAKVS